MSALQDAPATSPPPAVPQAPAPQAPASLDLGSVSSRIAQRARQRAEKRGGVLTVTVPGFEDLFAISYRRLTFEEKTDIAGRNEGLQDLLAEKPVDSHEMVISSADMLINACVDVLLVVGENEDGTKRYQSTGQRLTSSTIGSLFQLEPVPDTSRAALLQALDSEDLVDHFGRYMTAVNRLELETVESAEGESGPSVDE